MTENESGRLPSTVDLEARRIREDVLDEELVRRVPDAEAISPQTRKRVIREMSTLSMSSGPLPSPRMLAEYQEACPGSADRIIAMAEGDVEHFRSVDRAIHLYNMTGLIIAGVFAIAALVVTGWIVTAGYAVTGTIIGATTIASVVGAFIYGNSSAKKQRDKAPEVEKPAKAEKPPAKQPSGKPPVASSRPKRPA